MLEDLPRIYFTKWCFDEFFGSPSVRRMNRNERAAYAELLWYNIQNGYIPADLAALADITGDLLEHGDALPMLEKAWPRVSRCFAPVEGYPDRLSNPRVDRDRADMLEKSKTNAANGTKGGRAKAARKQKDAPSLTVVEQPKQTQTPKAATEPHSLQSDHKRLFNLYPSRFKAAAALKSWLSRCATEAPTAEDVKDLGLAIEAYESEQRAMAKSFQRKWEDHQQYVKAPSNFLDVWREYKDYTPPVDHETQKRKQSSDEMSRMVHEELGL